MSEADQVNQQASRARVDETTKPMEMDEQQTAEQTARSVMETEQTLPDEWGVKVLDEQAYRDGRQLHVFVQANKREALMQGYAEHAAYDAAPRLGFMGEYGITDSSRPYRVDPETKEALKFGDQRKDAVWVRRVTLSNAGI
jgi:hypothetical protein